MARRSQCSSAGDNPLDPNYLPPHYREEYRLAIDALIEEDLEGYYEFLQRADVVDFLSTTEVEYIQRSLQVPQPSNFPDRPFQEPGGDGSSDTYWPIHSDLDAPGLDLGWPQLLNFGGPTEVTTLVNPPEPDMPSIKEQARRLIKNAQQVIAIVMDMFTDVDMFADILSAAKRNVAVYVLLDEQNAHHFINMVSNCRVNLQNIPFVRVRTVSGITYHCRSGKSFKGQMIDRFLLTDCRAVLSGNYSFMWSFEKLHRCMAHLFFGQLVSTFDEEFRILYAQSLPLIPENVLLPTEDFCLSQKRQYPSKRTSLLREPRKFLPQDSAHSEEWARHSHDEHIDADWRMMPLKKQESFHGPGDIYSRIPSQQSQMEPHFDKGHYMLPLMDNTGYKRHSYADGVPGRYSYPFVQQHGLRDFETRGRQHHRGQQLNLGPGPEVEYSGHDKYWSQDYHSADQHSEPGLPQEMEQPEFDPVLNYLSSTRNVDFDQGSGQLQPPANLPFRRFSAGQAYTCQTTTSPPNPVEEKPLLQEPLPDRRDPTVKRGLRNWRINSYLSGFDSPGDEGLSLTPPQVFEPFEEPSKSTLQLAQGVDFPLSKIPNVREFKVPGIPRVSMMPSYSKAATQEQPKKSLEDRMGVSAEYKVTPSPSESSSITEGDKPEEEEQKEPSGLRRDDSFRRKYNVPIQRGSRLRSSLIFSSMDQDTKAAMSQKDEETDKNENEQIKLPFVAQVLGQRRTTAREPFEWSRYKKSSSIDDLAPESTKPDVGTSKAEQKDSMKEGNVSPSLNKSKPSVQPHKSLLASPLSVDMSDADKRLMFFKELAAKRKAAQIAKDEKRTRKEKMRKDESRPNENSENKADTSVKKPHGSYESLVGQNGAVGDLGETQSTDVCVDSSEKDNKESQVKNNLDISLSYGKEKTFISTDTEKIELRDSQSAALLPVSCRTEVLPIDLPEELNLPKPTITELHPKQRPASAEETPGKDLSLDTEKGSTLDSTSVEHRSFTSISPTLTPSSSSAALNSTHQKEESPKTQISILPPPPPSDLNVPTKYAELHTNHSLPDASSILRHVSSSLISEDPSPTPDSGILPQASEKLEPQESVSPSPTTEETSNEQTISSVMQSESTHLELSTSPEMSAAVNSDQDSLGTKQIKSPLQSKELSSLSLNPQNCSPESSINSVHSPIAEESHMASPFCASSQSAIAPLRPSSLSLHTCLPNIQQSTLEQEKEELVTTAPTLADSPHENSKPHSLDIPDMTSGTPSDPGISQDAPIQTNPSDDILTESDTLLLSETGSCSLSVESIMSSKADKTEASLTVLQTTPDSSSSPSEPPLDSNEAPTHISAEPPYSRTKPTSAGLPYETPQSETFESHISKSPTSIDKNTGKHVEENTETILTEACEKKNEDSEGSVKAGKTSVQESSSSDKANDLAGQVNSSKPAEINADEVAPQSKQPKSSQARCHSSTAKVLSSSNLRDDTKLLLEQISANSQTRIDSPKESPVTDDEKEDKADKNAQREKEKGIRSQSKGQPRSDEERAVLLERIESMRKERKVYSRFEMAP